jgi:hypothetical protein
MNVALDFRALSRRTSLSPPTLTIEGRIYESSASFILLPFLFFWNFCLANTGVLSPWIAYGDILSN